MEDDMGLLDGILGGAVARAISGVISRMTHKVSAAPLHAKDLVKTRIVK
jgi:hypothetical protein